MLDGISQGGDLSENNELLTSTTTEADINEAPVSCRDNRLEARPFKDALHWLTHISSLDVGGMWYVARIQPMEIAMAGKRVGSFAWSILYERDAWEEDDESGRWTGLHHGTFDLTNSYVKPLDEPGFHMNETEHKLLNAALEWADERQLFPSDHAIMERIIMAAEVIAAEAAEAANKP